MTEEFTIECNLCFYSTDVEMEKDEEPDKCPHCESRNIDWTSKEIIVVEE